MRLLGLITACFFGCSAAQASPHPVKKERGLGERFVPVKPAASKKRKRVRHEPRLLEPDGYDPDKLTKHALMCFWGKDSAKKITTHCVLLDVSSGNPVEISGAGVVDHIVNNRLPEDELMKTLGMLTTKLGKPLKYQPKSHHI